MLPILYWTWVQLDRFENYCVLCYIELVYIHLQPQLNQSIQLSIFLFPIICVKCRYELHVFYFS